MTSLRALPIPGGWSNCEIAVGHLKFRLLTPTNPDALLDTLESPEASGSPHLADPYWAKLWPAAPLLAEALVRKPPPRGAKVLELGCGSGLVGITALACGLDVTFTDYVPLAVDLALENAARNGFTNARGMLLDWRQRAREPCERFDLILAADVTYDRSNLDLLLEVVEERLVADGEAWFGDAGRSPALDFVERSKSRGWQVSCYDEADRPINDLCLGRFSRIVLRRAP